MLCAGLGTRLKPLTSRVPKPLVPVGDRPLVQYGMEQLRAAGVRHFELNAFHLAGQVESFAGRLAWPDARVACRVETELLGTAGGIRAMYAGQDSVVVWNGDIYAPDLDVATLLKAADPGVPVLCVSPNSAGTGSVGRAESGAVVRLRDVSQRPEHAAADYIGIAVLPRDFVRELPARGCLVGDGLLPWIAAGKPVRSHEYQGHWSDGGTLPQYLRQNLHWLDREHGGVSFVAPSASVDPSVRLDRCVIGQGAHVGGTGVLHECVVWPGALASAPASRTVFTTLERVLADDARPLRRRSTEEPND